MSAASNLFEFPETATDDESSYAAAHRHVGDDFVASPAHPSHFVQFYEEDESLVTMLGRFLGAGLRAGDRLVVIATPEHRAAILRQVADDGGDRAVASNQFVLLDARATLERFMVDGAPDPERFHALVAEVMTGLRRDAPGACVRAFGEMVDLLWRDGNSDGAIRLEQLWNDAGHDHDFALFCAYTVAHFYKESDATRFHDVCKNHTHVIPTESVARRRALEREIAQRQRLEEALRESLRRRTQSEDELRASLRREQEARSAAEENVQFRELFVSMLGHDLRNPLNTLLNTARVIALRKLVSAEGEKQLARVIASATRMQRMIDQMLDVSRARLGGGIPLERSWQDVDVVVAKIVDESRGAHPGRAIAYTKNGDCWASVDADRLEQVVSNLVGNALTHGAADVPVTVTLAGSALSIQLSVHNEGEPIAPAFMPLLFDPFTRTQKMPGPSAGLGLGLYIVDRIVRAHDGILRASSSPATGTLFEATLPKHERSGGR